MPARAGDRGRSGDGRQDLGGVQDRAEQVTPVGEPAEDVPDREAVRPQGGIIQLIPGDGRGHRGPGQGARTVWRHQRLVPGVLRVVQPSMPAAVAQLPLPAHQLRYDIADGPRELLDPGGDVGWAGTGAIGIQIWMPRRPVTLGWPRTPRWSRAVRCSRARTSTSSQEVAAPGSMSM